MKVVPAKNLQISKFQSLAVAPPEYARPLDDGLYHTIDTFLKVAEGELPIVISHGGEITAYKELDPRIGLFIFKALCEICLEQDDIWTYISDMLKDSDKFVAFYKEPVEGNNDGNFILRYEGDSIMGHQLYKEIQKVQNQIQSKGTEKRASLTVKRASLEKNAKGLYGYGWSFHRPLSL